jgi:hypothetical protein
LYTQIENFPSNSILAQYESGTIDCLKEYFSNDQFFMAMQNILTENQANYEFFIFLKKQMGNFNQLLWEKFLE